MVLIGLALTPYGWAYDLIDMGVLLYSGKSITDRVGDYVEEHWGTGPIEP